MILGNTAQPVDGIAIDKPHKSRIHEMLKSFIHSKLHCIM